MGEVMNCVYADLGLQCWHIPTKHVYSMHCSTLYSHIGLDKKGYQENSFLISRRKHICGYSLEAPRRGASNEYPQHMFLS